MIVARNTDRSAGEFQGRLAPDVGGDPEAILQRFREQVEAVAIANRRIAGLKARMAQLEARYGRSGTAGSHWEHDRKQLLAEIAEDVRLRYQKDPDMVTDAKGNTREAPLTDGRCSDMAHAEVRYKRFLAESLREREEYAKLHAELSDAFADQEKERGVQEYLRARLDMMKSLTYAWAAEARLQS